MEPILSELYDSVLHGNKDTAQSGVQSALDQGLNPSVILNDGMVSAMAEVGRLFEEQEYFVPEMLIAARAMKAGLEILRPHLVQADFKPIGKVVIGTVQGDLHDIGKNLVGMMLEGASFEVVDLGVDVSPEKFVEAAQGVDVGVVAISALLTTTMPTMKTTIEAFEKVGLRDKVKVIVGGAPVTSQYAEDIGADGYAADASQAVRVAKSLLP
ncbi:MAG: corrinoid protein [Anaerolineales bacterium]|jgi:5-methyltetrahydrofolate--homocysteine methyltransferase